MKKKKKNVTIDENLLRFQSHFSIVQKLSILASTACGHHPFVFAFIDNVSLLHFMSLSLFSSPQWGQSLSKGAIEILPKTLE